MLIYLICFRLLYYCFLQYLVAAIPPPSFNSIRILWMSWYLSVTLILMCTFAGQMKASMMFKPEKKRIDSIFNVYQKKKLKLYIPKDSIIERLLKVQKPNGEIQYGLCLLWTISALYIQTCKDSHFRES